MKMNLRKMNKLKIFTKNRSFNSVKKALQKMVETKTVISHGSRTEACIEACNKCAKEGGVVLNHPDCIKLASDKISCKNLMIENQLRTTPFQTFKEEFKLNFPVVAKLRKGSGGKGMRLINNKEELDTFVEENKDILGQYFLEEMFNPRKTLYNHIMTTRELRIHFSPWLIGKPISYTDILEDNSKNTVVDHLGIIFMTKKLQKDVSPETVTFGKNIAKGNTYFTRDLGQLPENLLKDVQCEVATLVNSLGLDYAAVDVLLCPEKNTWCILEVNTAPSFGEGDGITAGRYTVALNEIILAKKKYLCVE